MHPGIDIDRYENTLASKFLGINAYQLVFMSTDDYPNKCLCLSKGIDIDRYQCLFKSAYQYLSTGIENDRYLGLFLLKGMNISMYKCY